MDTQSKPSLDSFVGQPQQVSKPSLASFVKPYDGSQDITNSAAGLGMTNTLNSQDLNTLQTQHPDMNTQQFNDIQTQNPGASVAGVSDLATQQQTKDAINKGLSNVGGFIKGAINDAQKLGASALAMPIDIVRQLFGKTPLSGTYPSIVGNDPTKTFQADTQDYKTNVVDQGGGSMGQDLQQVTNPVMAGASLLGGFGENAAGDSLVKQGIDKGLDTASAGAGAASKLANTTKSAIQDTLSAVANKIGGYFKGKTETEILTTPENQLHKLSPQDRKLYFDTKRNTISSESAINQERITKESSQVESKIKSDADKKLSELQSQTQDLTNKVDRASLEEAQGLKPKVIQSMKQNSQTYRYLVDKEISQYKDVPIKIDDVKQFIENRYADNPSQASAIKTRLGLDEPVMRSPKNGELPTIQSGASSLKDTNIGEIYNNTKSLKQEISSSARKGTKSFTADDKLTDDSISVLSDFMKSKGVDLSEANKFWRNYAPLRDKVIKNIQPFTPRGAESSSFEKFAKDIQKSIKGTDEGNKDFISATENLLNTKIGSPQVRTALEKLSANEKSQIAEKIASDNKILENKFAKEQAIKESKGNYTTEQKEIDAREFEVNRKAQTRTNIWRALKWTGAGAVSLEEFHRLTGK